MLAEVLADIHVPRHGKGRPRTRPDAVIADKAYSSGTIRRQLRSRGIAAVIPEKSDTIAARERRGSRGGRPPKLDTDLYNDRNVIWQIGPVGTSSPAIWYFDSGDLVLLGAGGVVCSR